MKISDIMTRDVCLVSPQQSIREAAELMQQHDIGSLPVEDNERLVGMLTDRDIVIRAIARGLGVDTPVREVMTSDIKFCFDDQDIDEVARNMADLEIRRLPVVNRDKRLVGIVSLANVAHSEDDAADRLVRGVARPH
ncbi:MAG TPA: CBS domain-containing protein [Lysobacter sp.]|nr:CBS domain-containing protein [Lysobacter sp.]